MQKTLVQHGNSYALIIDKAILELLRIERDTMLEIRTDGESLIVRPLRKDERLARTRKTTMKMMKAHDAALRKLAK